ncbi:hypothetical protein MMK62_003542 [Pseudomonas aeruginosa]|uniref:hypothetical protein n=1 Tax=Pseudomonas aeruginosa TaxID=287 RepID=UPI0009408265|nr:hypothetical protein [Pseudomonas aeruginosa]EIU4992725.1 hypothetical protein [Pseudomonas aeruginosa]EIY2608854.1 hypothetical protein [Pseudomonas aeruginosa]EIY2740370.1 hypothetical protein [Pseudomonas aeruginosa]EKM0198676.1 hypothetical protein [Pseudomonas aeruginosa]EKM0218308.1 hypothetical protein [Pseudomonas aeruginosa]
MAKKVELELSVWVDGRQWNLFTFDYDTPDGKFSGYLHAISPEHAAEMLMDMKANATMAGQMIEVIEP